jgi:DNA-binding transcriptional LysR family regulator
MLLKMALNGDGITVLPDFICQKYIDNKELVRVIPSWSSRADTSHILYPPTKNLPKKVKLFIDLAMKVS